MLKHATRFLRELTMYLILTPKGPEGAVPSRLRWKGITTSKLFLP